MLTNTWLLLSEDDSDIHRIFTGWVPTITGNLSFSTIGLSRSPRKVIKLFRDYKNNRYTVAVQKRRTSDAVFSRVVDWPLGRRGVNFFCFFGISTRDAEFDRIFGPAFVISPDLYRRVKPLFDLLSESHDVADFEYWFNKCIERLEIEMASDAAKTTPTNATKRVDVCLQRDGKIDIDLDTSLFEKATVPLLASQFYFFVRDICHVHQHHEKRSDTILDVYESLFQPNEWKRETLYALHRWIIHRKRDRTLLNYIRAKGVLAYAKAFTGLHVSELDYKSGIPRYLDETISDSLDAAIAEREERLREEASLRTVYVAIALGVLSIFVMFASLLGDIYNGLPRAFDGVQQVEIFRKMLSVIAIHPLDVFFGSMFLAMYYLVAIRLRTFWPNGSFGPFVRDVLRLLYSVPFAASITLLSLMLVLTVVLALVMYFKAIGVWEESSWEDYFLIRGLVCKSEP